MPDVPPPEELPTLAERYADQPELQQELLARPHPIERRYVDPPSWEHTGSNDGAQRLWIRANGTPPDDPLLARA